MSERPTWTTTVVQDALPCILIILVTEFTVKTLMAVCIYNLSHVVIRVLPKVRQGVISRYKTT